MSTKNYTFYKFVCINDDVKSCYVGSSANMKKRRTNHKNNCHNENRPKHNYKIYKTIRENGGWSNWKIVEFATRDNITRREAERIEEEYRVQIKADMNDRRAFLSPEQKKEYKKEYYENNKEKINEQKKEYYENNKEKIKEYHKEWYENNPEYNKEYYEQNKEKINEKCKEYKENNKEKIKEYKKEYRENNKEKINEKHNCPCGGRYTHQNKTIHFKTQKHKKYLGDCTTEANLNP